MDFHPFKNTQQYFSISFKRPVKPYLIRCLPFVLNLFFYFSCFLLEYLNTVIEHLIAGKTCRHKHAQQPITTIITYAHTENLTKY